MSTRSRPSIDSDGRATERKSTGIKALWHDVAGSPSIIAQCRVQPDQCLSPHLIDGGHAPPKKSERSIQVLGYELDEARRRCSRSDPSFSSTVLPNGWLSGIHTGPGAVRPLGLQCIPIRAAHSRRLIGIGSDAARAGHLRAAGSFTCVVRVRRVRSRPRVGDLDCDDPGPGLIAANSLAGSPEAPVETPPQRHISTRLRWSTAVLYTHFRK